MISNDCVLMSQTRTAKLDYCHIFLTSCQILTIHIEWKHCFFPPLLAWDVRVCCKEQWLCIGRWCCGNGPFWRKHCHSGCGRQGIFKLQLWMYFFGMKKSSNHRVFSFSTTTTCTSWCHYGFMIITSVDKFEKFRFLFGLHDTNLIWASNICLY